MKNDADRHSIFSTTILPICLKFLGRIFFWGMLLDDYKNLLACTSCVSEPCAKEAVMCKMRNCHGLRAQLFLFQRLPLLVIYSLFASLSLAKFFFATYYYIIVGPICFTSPISSLKTKTMIEIKGQRTARVCTEFGHNSAEAGRRGLSWINSVLSYAELHWAENLVQRVKDLRILFLQNTPSLILHVYLLH